MTTDPIILSYLAGVVDSDGSIFITKRTGTKQDRNINYLYYVVISISQVSKEALELFSKSFGGTLTEYQPSKHTTFRSRQVQYRWTVSSQRAKICLFALQPYIRIKKYQVKISLKLLETMPSKLILNDKKTALMLDPKIVKERELCWKAMRNYHITNGKGHQF